MGKSARISREKGGERGLFRAAAMSEAIAVLARAPVPGRVKTRLVPALGETGAALAHLLLLRRTLLVALLSGRPVYCYSEQGWRDPLFAGVSGLYWREQEGGGLGERMQHAVAATHPGAQRVVLVGSDCPTLSVQYFDQAFAALTDREWVIGPAEDGGYVLLGSRRASFWQGADPLVGCAFGGPLALRDTLQAMDGKVALLPEKADLDTPADLSADANRWLRVLIRRWQPEVKVIGGTMVLRPWVPGEEVRGPGFSGR